MSSKPTNVVIAGLGGQGVIKASDILADVAFSSGLDVKKSELHGMSQRGGSVSSDVRFGERVFSPMVPEKEADFLLVIAPDQVEVNAAVLGQNGILISNRRIQPVKQEEHQRGAPWRVEPSSAVFGRSMDRRSQTQSARETARGESHGVLDRASQ
jgi:indolepyruvate ferredoxin oxidoreductase beta subunit